jgi:hypothetical protein
VRRLFERAQAQGGANNRGDYQAQNQSGHGLGEGLHSWMAIVNHGDHNPSGYPCENIFETISGRDDYFYGGVVSAERASL